VADLSGFGGQVLLLVEDAKSVDLLAGEFAAELKNPRNHAIQIRSSEHAVEFDQKDRQPHVIEVALESLGTNARQRIH
jgi:hypothetical protein